LAGELLGIFVLVCQEILWVSLCLRYKTLNRIGAELRRDV